MATYRAYLVDDDGHFVGVHVLAECLKDDDAITAAKGLADGYVIQLWALDRFVCTIGVGEPLARTG